jgi:hypothetical protein
MAFNFFKKVLNNKKGSEDEMSKEGIKITGRLKLTGRDKNGNVLFIKKEKNLITNAGFDFICDVIGKATQPGDITHMAIGNGIAGNATATALTNETDRQPATYAHTNGTKTFTLTATFSSVSGATEYGCLNASSGGTLLNTAGFDSITVDSLEIEATFTLS